MSEFDTLVIQSIVPLMLIYSVFAVRKDMKRQRSEADSRLRDEHVPDMSPLEYEQFIARQLEQAGWTVTHCGRPGDQGCDVLAELKGFRAVIQAKLYRKPCGNRGVQEVIATRRHYQAQIMAVVCPAGFTPAAKELAASNGVHLLHHNELRSLEKAARIP